MKKKLPIIIISSVVVVVLTISLSLYFTRYAWDVGDTKALFTKNVLKVGYENTIETAYPQTDLYDVIVNHYNAPLKEGTTTKKAILIGYDGCRADVLTEMQNDNSGIKELLNDGASINLTYAGGVNYPEKNTQATSTAPGWCSILTGEWASVHGIDANGITKTLETKTLLTSLTESGTINGAHFITKWDGHFENKKSTYRLEKEYAESNGLNVNYVLCIDDQASHQATINEVNKQDCSDFLFVIYEHTDATGHNSGFSFNNPKYKTAFKDADKCGYETIKAIKNRATYESEDWLIIITSDHGGIKTGHGKASIQERMTFVVMNQAF